ncbi:MAG: hypothetical protein EBR09_13310 [Proteobacteria bacterium]|nr:hypothetical protein [Pseudomonadota bacterium]
MRNVFSVSLFLGVLAAACGTTGESGTQGWGLQSVAHKSTTINVCWENRSESDVLLKKFRFEFENHARSQFGRTKLSLVGWQDCSRPSGKDEIRITWWDQGETDLNQFGRSKVGALNVIYTNELHKLPQIINSSFKAAPTLALNGHAFSVISQKAGLTEAKGVFKNTFLHELGHAIGMLHEHAHPANNNFCTPTSENFKSHLAIWGQFDSQSIAKSAVGTSVFDSRSIMNYCHLEAVMGNVVGLSDGDIATVNALYSPSFSKPSVAQVMTKPAPQPSVAQPMPKPSIAQPSIAQPSVALPSIAQPSVALPSIAQPSVAQPMPKPSSPSSSPKFVSSVPMGACQSVFKVDDFLPQLVTLDGNPAFVCEDIMNLGYAPVLICTNSFNVGSCVPTKFEFVRGNFVTNRFL